MSPGHTRNVREAGQAVAPGFESLRRRLDSAVNASGVEAVVGQVKDILEGALRAGGFALPAAFHEPRPDSYARRLLHRDPDGRYTAVVMTWGPGQKTALHDHAGIWCVECVVQGEMEVTQYDLLSEADGAYRFRQQNHITATRGSAGCLIPPFEYHTLSNARPHDVSITLHVYGGDMDHCHAFEPASDGSYRKLTRPLVYHQ